MVSGVSQLGITLTSLNLVDGQDLPIQSQMVLRRGPTSVGRDAAALASTTALGAAIGGAAGGGSGAAIGAGAGAVTGTIGVLLTRGYPTVLGPETPMTFEITAPVTIDTQYAPQAFRGVESADYPQDQTEPQPAPAPPAAAPAPPAVPPPPYAYPYSLAYWPPYYPYYYPYYPYPYYYGPAISFYFGYPGYYSYPRYYSYHGYYARPYYGYRGYYGGYHGFYGHGHAGGPAPYHGGMVAHGSHGGLHR